MRAGARNDGDPPADTLAALPQLPLVIWAAHRRSSVPEQFDHGGITAEGATVGTPMLTSVLVRMKRQFKLIIGRLQDEVVIGAVMSALLGAAAATRVRGARIGRVGPVQEGYLCVDTPDELLEGQLGAEIVRLAATAMKDAYDRVDPARRRAVARGDRTPCTTWMSQERGSTDRCAPHARSRTSSSSTG